MVFIVKKYQIKMEPFEDWYKKMPIVTRTYMTICFLTTLVVYLEIVSPLSLYLNFAAVFREYEVFFNIVKIGVQLTVFFLKFWRLLTNFFFFDYFGINFIFHIFFL